MIKLFPFKKDDFEQLISWVDNQETLVQFAGTYFSFPLTQKQLEQYLEDNNRFAYKVVLFSTNTTIGHAEIYLDNRIAIFCRIIIGDPGYRGQGIGQQIVNRLLEISFTELAAEKAELNVFDWNIAAIKCYRKAGFATNTEKTKTRKVNGKIWTALNMIIDKRAWEFLKH